MKFLSVYSYCNFLFSEAGDSGTIDGFQVDGIIHLVTWLRLDHCALRPGIEESPFSRATVQDSRTNVDLILTVHSVCGLESGKDLRSEWVILFCSFRGSIYDVSFFDRVPTLILLDLLDAALGESMVMISQIDFICIIIETIIQRIEYRVNFIILFTGVKLSYESLIHWFRSWCWRN